MTRTERENVERQAVRRLLATVDRVLKRFPPREHLDGKTTRQELQGHVRAARRLNVLKSK